MKLRIYDNSIRLRLSRSEVALFADNGWVESSLDFGTSCLVYRLEVDPGAADTAADLNERRITVRLPKQTADNWCRSDEITINGGSTINIAVEKDLACLHKDNGEDDTFPNPMARGAI